MNKKTKSLSAIEVLGVNHYKLTAQDKARFFDEAELGMVAVTDPVLNFMSAKVPVHDLVSESIQDTIKRLLAVAGGQRQANQANKRRRTLVGLAAPQIGESLRIIVADTHVSADRKRYGRLECFINPEIVWRSRETAEDREGCFSAGPVWGLVRRPIAVKVRALTPDGKQIERIFEGFSARIMQHEIDHLDGIRFPERIKSDKKRHWVHAEELAIYPKHIKSWPRICTKARWEAYRRGASGLT